MAIDSYVVTLTTVSEEGPSSTEVVTASNIRQYSFTGLTNGQEYEVAVQAVNFLGRGPAGTARVIPQAPAILPTAPRSVVTRALDRAAEVSWLAPTNAAESAVIDYLLTVVQTGTATQQVVDAASPALISGLTNGVSAAITIVARSAAGNSPSVTVFVTPTATPTGETVPGVVGALQVDSFLTGVALAWTAPVAPGTRPVTAYLVSATAAGFSPVAWLVPSTVTEADFFGLGEGEWTISVQARSLAGTGTASSVSADLTAEGLTLLSVPYYRPTTASTVFSILDTGTTIPPEEEGPDRPRVKAPQPLVEAFPQFRNFRPANFGKTLEEVLEGE
jgi:titin